MAISILKTRMGPVLRFGPIDLEGMATPDALVIQTTIANFDIGIVFIDASNSINILYWLTLEHMDMKIEDLQPVAISLFRFSRHEVQSLDQIKLLLSLGT